VAESKREATRVLLQHGRAVASFVQKVRLTIRGSDGNEQVRDFAQPVIRAGAQAGNDVVLADEAVSRIHFEISGDRLGFRLRDLGSTNGTFVESFRITDGYLRSGCRIRAGRTTIHFEALDSEGAVELSTAHRYGPLVGTSAAMRALFATLARIAPTNATVLIEGESGTGKELIAQAIHAASSRAEEPFVVFDCASTPANLMESELFGHEKGAFTSADGGRTGRIEEAEGGTLFLDEIGELPLDLQPKLLRAVEAREFRRLGGDRPRKADIRIVTATNRDLAGEVNRGTFRHDLYYRLAVVRLEVPPLRARVEDLPLLIERFVEAITDSPSAAREIVEGITKEHWARLEAHAWRGNVRELRNLVDRALALGSDLVAGLLPTGGAIAPAAIPKAARRSGEQLQFQEAKRDVLAAFEHEYFSALYAECGGNISEMSRRSGMERAHVRGYLRRSGIGEPK
jgi:two-component system, NtrC family, response regulator GlrR